MQHDLTDLAVNTGCRALNRRALLKSTGLLLTASALAPVGLAADPQSHSAGAPVSDAHQGFRTAPSMLHPLMGFMLGHEQFPVPELVQLGIAAEQAGFDLLATSDHLQTWQANEKHAGEAWVTMSALGGSTRSAWIGDRDLPNLSL